jgi:CubicO group peptidase (beta-lactamase class C family)
MDETICRYANLVTPPGQREHYSNLAFGILDYIIQRTSGRPYADFMRSEVFLPLGMTHSSVDVGPGLEAFQAVRYTPDGKRIPFYDFDHPGASAVYSSAHDLIRFAMFHMKNRLDDQKAILSDDSIDAMQQPTATLAGKPGTYGIAWGLRNGFNGYRTVSHTGGMPGVSTSLILVPEANIAVSVLCNARSNLPDAIAETILKHILPPRDGSSPVAQAVAFAAGGISEDFQPSTELVGTWEGFVATYDRDIPVKLWIFDSGDVHMQLDDQLKTLVNRPRLRDGY